jgi:hypothetical protein
MFVLNELWCLKYSIQIQRILVLLCDRFLNQVSHVSISTTSNTLFNFHCYIRYLNTYFFLYILQLTYPIFVQEFNIFDSRFIVTVGLYNLIFEIRQAPSERDGIYNFSLLCPMVV